MYELNEKFKNGVTSVEDSSLQGQAVTENFTAAKNVIRENRRQSRRWHHYWTLVLDQSTTSFMTSLSSKKCVQDGYPSD